MLDITADNTYGEVRNMDFVSYRELRRMQSKRTLEDLRAELARSKTTQMTAEDASEETPAAPRKPQKKSGKTTY
jgi:hypothetical protein